MAQQNSRKKPFRMVPWRAAKVSGQFLFGHQGTAAVIRLGLKKSMNLVNEIYNVVDIFRVPLFNTDPLNSTQKSFSSTQNGSTQKSVCSTHPSVQHKKASVPHTRRFTTKKRQFHTPNGSTQKSVSSTHRTDQHKKALVPHTRQFTIKKRQFHTPNG